MKLFDEFHERRETGNQRISRQDFLPYSRFLNLDTNTYSDGEIPVKYKEMMGLSCSLLLRCNDCVLYHIEKCVMLGCSRRELNECMNIALVIGGSIIIPHLRFALSALDELLPETISGETV